MHCYRGYANSYSVDWTTALPSTNSKHRELLIVVGFGSFAVLGTERLTDWEFLLGFRVWMASNRRHEVYKEMMASMEKPRVVEEDVVVDEVDKNGPLIVRFPRQTTAPVEPVKLESEEAEKESKPPRNMIQVYLLAGYLVGRWAWARFQERQTRRRFDNKRNSED